MKNIFFALLVVLLSACADKMQYTINGKGKCFSDGHKVYLLQRQNDSGVLLKLGTTLVANGAFSIEGRVEEPVDALLLVCDSTSFDENSFQFLNEDSRPCVVHFFLEPGKITVAPIDDDAQAVASGTPLNDLYNKFQADADSVKKNVGTDPNTIFNFVVPFIKKNVANIVGVTVFETWHASMPRDVKLEILDSLEIYYGDKYAPLSAETREGLQRERLREEQRKAVSPGCKYKDIEEKNVDGKVVSLKNIVEDSKNKYVLLEFWATWCRPCMAEVPILLDAYKNYKHKGLEIYAVSMDDDADQWAAAIKEKGMRWVNVIQDAGGDTRDKYGIQGAGGNFLIDCATGEIVAVSLRGDALIEKLSNLFD